VDVLRHVGEMRVHMKDAAQDTLDIALIERGIHALMIAEP
jgi:hypothetical protein